MSEMAGSHLMEILNPKSIAVIGASQKQEGRSFFAPLLEFGFEGPVYPVNPNYESILNIPCYPRVTDIPGPVDYVISRVPSTAALDILKDCVTKKVKCIHFFTARFSETGVAEDRELEQEILRIAREGGVRLIGPNCMGLYYPGRGISMMGGLPKESGSVGLLSQSGGVLMETVNSMAQRGLRFSKAISYGNALDLNECDYLEHFTDDPDTRVILMYIEGVRDGPRFIRALKNATARKPVVILKGGRGHAGTRATQSHTASLAGSFELFRSLVHGAGAVTVKDFAELADVAVAFHFLPATTGKSVAVMGGAGGSSVNAADVFEEAGLHLPPIPQEIRDALAAKGFHRTDWYNNPIDGSVSPGDEMGGGMQALLDLMLEHDDFQTFIARAPRPRMNPGMDGISLDIDYVMEQSLHRRTKKPVIMLTQEYGGMIGQMNRFRPPGSEDSMPTLEELTDFSREIQQRLFDDGIATFPDMTRTANALGKVIDFYRRREA